MAEAEQIAIGKQLSDIITKIDDSYDFKKYLKCQLEGYGKCVGLLMEMSGLEDSGRDAEERLQNPDTIDRLDRMITMARQVTTSVKQVSKIIEEELATQRLGDSILNPSDFRMDSQFSNACRNDVFVDVIALRASQMGQELLDIKEKVASLTKGLHSGETSWKRGLTDESEAAKVISMGEKLLSGISGALLGASVSEFEKVHGQKSCLRQTFV